MHGDIATYIGTLLTAASLAMCWKVCQTWWPAAKLFFLSILKGARPSARSLWLAGGIWIGFAGGLGDNSWWGWAWPADMYDLPFRDFLFDYGTTANIPFRQLAFILSGYCHLKAHDLTDGDRVTDSAVGLMGVSMILAGTAMAAAEILFQ